MVVRLDLVTGNKILFCIALENLRQHISDGVGLSARKCPLNVTPDSMPKRPIHMGRIHFATRGSKLAPGITADQLLVRVPTMGASASSACSQNSCSEIP